MKPTSIRLTDKEQKLIDEIRSLSEAHQRLTNSAIFTWGLELLHKETTTKFTYEVIIFTSSGDYYASSDELKVPEYLIKNNVVSMWELKDYVLNLRTIPGLANFEWDGPILILCEGGWPLLLPEGI